jgi:hypothetical protein
MASDREVAVTCSGDAHASYHSCFHRDTKFGPSLSSRTDRERQPYHVAPCCAACNISNNPGISLLTMLTSLPLEHDAYTYRRLTTTKTSTSQTSRVAMSRFTIVSLWNSDMVGNPSHLTYRYSAGQMQANPSVAGTPARDSTKLLSTQFWALLGKAKPNIVVRFPLLFFVQTCYCLESLHGSYITLAPFNSFCKLVDAPSKQKL